MATVAAIPVPDPPPADEELVLGPFSDQDVALLGEICNDPEIARFTFLPAPYELSHAIDFVENQDSRRASGEALDLAIRSRHGNELLGATGLRVFNFEAGSCEIGYWVAPEVRGTGIAPRAVRLYADWVFATLPLSRIELTTDAPNSASRRVAEKAGFTLTDEVRERHAKGRRWRMLVYALHERHKTPQ